MKHETVGGTGNGAITRIPARCGEVTVGCTDVAGIVQEVIVSSERLRAEHAALRGTVEALGLDQRKVSSASGEARQLSERAIERLGQGTSLIQSSLGQITALLQLVETLTQHVTGFAAAMEQVRSSAQDIEQIAETTNILALNATIEAMRAGEAGRTFAVVANEVKGLAADTRKATNEIARTIDTLGGEAQRVIERIETGAKASGEAKLSVSRIEDTITGVSELVEEVDRQNENIARATSTISDHVDAVQGVLKSFDEVALENERKLENAHQRMAALEMTASEMFDDLVKAGLSPNDSIMVERAQAFAAEVADIAERAIRSGAIDLGAFFDQDYRPVAGSNPPRFRTPLSDWADVNWRPVLDRVAREGEGSQMACQADMNGFLPTHASDHSREPTGDLKHDTKYCRNGRILLGPIDRKAKLSTDPYMMAVYRQEGDGKRYVVLRNIFVPLFIGGRRWGDFELAYTSDED